MDEQHIKKITGEAADLASQRHWDQAMYAINTHFSAAYDRIEALEKKHTLQNKIIRALADKVKAVANG